jgi:hypothetical protein
MCQGNHGLAILEIHFERILLDAEVLLKMTLPLFIDREMVISVPFIFACNSTWDHYFHHPSLFTKQLFNTN